MGNCCHWNKNKIEDAQFINDGKLKKENDIEHNNNNLETEDIVKYIPSSPNEPINFQINSKFNNQKKSDNKLSEDRPDVMDEIIRNVNMNNFDISLNESKSEENQFNVSLITMEKEMFSLVNELRTNPKSFISKVEEYKNKLENNKDFCYLTIDDNMFEFRKGAKVFDECINFLKEQKTLKKFESSPSMFEAKTLFKDKNVSDLNFVLVYNLIDSKDPEDNKAKRNCLMSDTYNKLNITITKDDVMSNLFTFYFSFDQ